MFSSFFADTAITRFSGNFRQCVFNKGDRIGDFCVRCVALVDCDDGTVGKGFDEFGDESLFLSRSSRTVDDVEQSVGGFQLFGCKRFQFKIEFFFARVVAGRVYAYELTERRIDDAADRIARRLRYFRYDGYELSARRIEESRFAGGRPSDDRDDACFSIAALYRVFRVHVCITV